MRILVATANFDLDLDLDVRLLKTAVLYGDTAVLLSNSLHMWIDFTLPTLSAHAADAALDELERDQPTLDVRAVRDLAERYHKLDPGEERDAVTDELRLLLHRYGYMAGYSRRSERKAERRAREMMASIPEILEVEAIRNCELVETLWLPRERYSSTSPFDPFFEVLADQIAQKDVIPVFDDQVKLHLSHMLSADAGSTTRPESREFTVAAYLFDKLPAFDRASLDEIIDLRAEFAGPLTRFRVALADLAAEAALEGDSSEVGNELERLYRQRVAPALLELEEEIDANSYARALVGQIVNEFNVVASAIVAVGVAAITGIPALAAGAAAVAPAARAAWKHQEEERRLQRHQLFFLHGSEKRLRRHRQRWSGATARGSSRKRPQ